MSGAFPPATWLPAFPIAGPSSPLSVSVAPDTGRGLKSIIDYFVVRRDSRVRVKDVKVVRGADVGSDHYLLLMKMSRGCERVKGRLKTLQFRQIG